MDGTQNKFLWFKYCQSYFKFGFTFIQNEIENFFSKMDTQTKTKAKPKIKKTHGVVYRVAAQLKMYTDSE